jgi:hypothetical protein
VRVLLSKAVVLILAVVLLVGCSGDPNVTQEPTPYRVTAVHSGAIKTVHYLLPGHDEVVSATDLITTFFISDLTQSWNNPDWSNLGPLVSENFHDRSGSLANHYVVNQLKTSVEEVDINQIIFISAVGLPGSPLNTAEVSVDVTIRYLQGEADWLTQTGVVLDKDYMFSVPLTLRKENDKWKVHLLRYSRHPAYGPIP